MARAPTTSDAFNAVAEPRRRQILDLLALGEKPVNDMVASLGLAQPQVSKHLRVLREVGLVSVRGSGQQRLYKLNADRLKAIHDWVRTFEPFWDHQLDRIKERAERKANERSAGQDNSTGRNEHVDERCRAGNPDHQHPQGDRDRGADRDRVRGDARGDRPRRARCRTASRFPMVIEPWPGGRWYRDLGNNAGHLWGHVQVIKPPTLLELCGPMFMSFPAPTTSSTG